MHIRENSDVSLSGRSQVSNNIANGCGGFYVTRSQLNINDNSEVSNNISEFIRPEDSKIKLENGAGGICSYLNSRIVLNDKAKVKNNVCHTESCVGGISLMYANLIVVSDQVEVTSNQGGYVGGILSVGSLYDLGYSQTSGDFNFQESFLIANNTGGSIGGVAKINGEFVADYGLRIIKNSGEKVGGLYIENINPEEISNQTIITENTAGEGAGGVWFKLDDNIDNKELFAKNLNLKNTENNNEKANKQIVIEIK